MKLKAKQPALAAALIAATISIHAADRIVWSEGHGDLAVNYLSDAWQWSAFEGHAVDDVLIRLNAAARNEIPDIPAFSFLGEPGDSIWIIPSSQTAGVPFLGVSSETTPAGTFLDNRFDLILTTLSGPGHFHLWTTTGTGTPTILMNSQDGIATADKADLPAGGHSHQNWGFTSPGTYRLGFKADGTLPGGNASAENSEAELTFEVNVIKTGEADIEVAFESGALDFHVHDELAGQEHEPAHVALQAGPASWRTVPADPAFSFLGEPLASTYVLPQEETEGVLFLGLAAGEISAGTLLNDRLSVKLLQVEGPGTLACYELNSFGAPVVAFNSADGITEADAITLGVGSHSHRNWAFSAPGFYKVTLQATASLPSGEPIASEPATFHFEVLPPAFFEAGEIELEAVFEERVWDLALLDEAAEREFGLDQAVLVLNENSVQIVPEDATFRFLGTPGATVHILPQQETEGLLFLGIAGDEIEAGIFNNDQMHLQLVSAEGPGTFALFPLDQFGAPAISMNSADGITPEDTFPFAAGSHNHLNWAFTAPGEYRLGFTVGGTLTETGLPTVSEKLNLRVLVRESIQQPGLALSASRAGQSQLRIDWPGRTGVSYQLQSRSAATGDWFNFGIPVTGIAGTQSITVDIEPDSFRMFRLLETAP